MKLSEIENSIYQINLDPICRVNKSDLESDLLSELKDFIDQINLDSICRVNKSDGLLVCGLSASLQRSMCHRQQSSMERKAIWIFGKTGKIQINLKSNFKNRSYFKSATVLHGRKNHLYFG